MSFILESTVSKTIFSSEDLEARHILLNKLYKTGTLLIPDMSSPLLHNKKSPFLVGALICLYAIAACTYTYKCVYNKHILPLKNKESILQNHIKIQCYQKIEGYCLLSLNLSPRLFFLLFEKVATKYFEALNFFYRRFEISNLK